MPYYSAFFPFSLLGRAKQWFYANIEKNATWNICATTFLAKFFPIGKTNALRAKISTFQQQYDESVPGALERFQDYISEYPHHGMEDWILIETFYHGLTTSAHENIDGAARGSFFSLTIREATTLVEKIALNQGWNEEHTQSCKKRGMHQVKEVDMLSAKMDLLMKKLGEHDQQKKHEVMLMHDSHITCEKCGGNGHMGSNCREVQEDVNYVNNKTNYHPQQNQGWNQQNQGWNQQQRSNYSHNYSGNYQDHNFNKPPLREMIVNQNNC